MEIKINALNRYPSQELLQFIDEKMEKLSRHSSQIIRAEVTLKTVNHHQNTGNKVCEVRLVVPGYDHYVAKSSDDFQKSVSSAIDALSTILERKKGGSMSQRRSEDRIY
jgi:ribosomal subunit interface protein